MKANSWLYHYYMVQSRLQYGLAYGANPGLAAYYPQMLASSPQPQPFYEANPHTLSSAYLGHTNTGFSSGSSLYPSYLYNHPTPTYHLPSDHSLHNLTTTKDMFHGPLDFSKDFSRAGEYTRSHEYSSQQSSPSLGSDTSGSPVYQPPHDSLYGSEVALLSQARYSHSDHHYKPVEPRTDLLRDTRDTSRRENSMLLWGETEVRVLT